MNEIESTPTNDWAALLNDLKESEGIASDAKLAELLGVSRGYICSVLKGRKGLSLEVAERVLVRLDRAFDTGSLSQLFVPRSVQQRVRYLTIVREHVLQRARYCCQMCGSPAPFMDAKGKPYLAIHHVKSAKNGDISTPDNLVALCPNCHSKIRVNATASEKKKLQKLAAKYKEQESDI